MCRDLLQQLQTSVVFTLEEGPGVLFKALAVFALRNINISKVIKLKDLNWLNFKSSKLQTFIYKRYKNVETD
jgi:hypothetical protein